MRLNDNTCIVGNSVLLVPYMEYHVPKYHEWMKSEELQRQTASEPLSLDEECEMQKNWHEDNDKCTFIIIDKFKFESCGDEIGAMIGDTNLFFLDENHSEAEVEIMIAETDARGKKRGWEAVLMMMRYGIGQIRTRTVLLKTIHLYSVFPPLLHSPVVERGPCHRPMLFAHTFKISWIPDRYVFLIAQIYHYPKPLPLQGLLGIEKLHTSRFEAKIKFDNCASKKMFTKIGFSEVSRSEVFSECTFQKIVSDEWIQWIFDQTVCYKLTEYDKNIKKYKP